ncbi:SCO2583/SCO2584 N-terminal domain-containing protein [Kitasatospora sp. P5_F3]
MPIAEEPEQRPAEQPDPFEGLVLDEEFVRSATVKEQSGRTRMLAARWKHQPPVDPGGRRSVNDGPQRSRARGGSKAWQTWLIVLAMIAIVLFSLQLATDTGGDQPRPAPSSPAVQPSADATLRVTTEVPKPV